MRAALLALFSAVLASMLYVTVTASFERSIVDATGDLLRDAWFRATLADAYFGFVTIWLWIAYRERGTARRALWLVLVLGLGNIAIASYVLLQLARLRPGEPVERILLRRDPDPSPAVR
jgi:hypothetical protein